MTFLKILLGVLAALAAAAALWWLAMYRPAKLLEAQQADAAVARANLQQEREAMFGADALSSEVQWRETGLGYHILSEGTGPKPGVGTRVRMNYLGRLREGTIFDQSKQPVDFAVGQMVPGMNAAVMMLGAGGKGVFFIPPTLGYGRRAVGPIPANAGLIFEIELVAVNP